jgi:DNA-binding CsgD family transcriptional regulator
VELLLRVERLCQGTLSAKALREQVLARVRERIAYDAYVFSLTDPVTKVATAPLADVPMLEWPRLPELIRWRYLTLVNRPDQLTPGEASSLLTATQDPAESLLWLHVQRSLGVVDTAAVTFGDRYGVWGYLDLWRATGPFLREELTLLSQLAPTITHGLRAAVARTFVDASEQLRPVGPAVVVLRPDLVVRTQTEAAANTLLALLPPDEPMAPIPAAAYNIGGALMAQEAGIPIGEPWARVHLGGSRWVTVKASRLAEDIAVSIEPSTATERMDLFARASGLSARESEILSLLGIGLDSREIAARLVLSEHTVNDHVKAVLGKTGARTRQVLISRALGAG